MPRKELISRTALQARYSTLLARDKAPQAIELLASYLSSPPNGSEPEEIVTLRGLMASGDDKVVAMAARALGDLRQRAAGKLLDIARLIDARQEPVPDRKGRGGIKIVIARQGREVAIEDERSGERVTIGSDLTADCESVHERLSLVSS